LFALGRPARVSAQPQPNISVSPASHDFGDTPLGSTVSKSLRLKNIGTADLTVTTTAFRSPSTDFNIISGGAFVVAAGDSHDVTVDFTPGSVGVENDTLDITSDDPDQPILAIPLTGNGVTVPDIAITPTSNDFGSVAQGMMVMQTFAVSNNGQADLNVSLTEIIGTDAGDFSIVTGGGGFALAPTSNSTQAIEISFLPAAIGLRNAVLRLTSNDPDQSQLDVALSGTGFSTNLPGSPVTFSVTGDYPYGSSELADLEQHMNDHNRFSPADFFVHVGDINAGSESCQQQRYEDVAALLKTLAVPAFIIPGDNEWTDCSNPTQGWAWWAASFTDFDQNFCGLLLYSARQDVTQTLRL